MAVHVQAELASAQGRVAQLEGDLSAWEAAVEARDTELRNLQVCAIWRSMAGSPKHVVIESASGSELLRLQPTLSSLSAQSRRQAVGHPG